MASPESIKALKKSGKHKTTIRLEGVFNYVKRWIEAPLTIGEIVYRGRRSYVEVKCTRHDRIIKVKTIKQLMKEDLILCKSCSKERYSRSMIVKMQEFDARMKEENGIKPRTAGLKGTIKNHVSDYEREITNEKKYLTNATITPKILKDGLEDYFKRGGEITRIGNYD